MAVQLGAAERNRNDDGKCTCIMYWNFKNCELQTLTKSFYIFYSFVYIQ